MRCSVERLDRQTIVHVSGRTTETLDEIRSFAADWAGITWYHLRRVTVVANDEHATVTFYID